MRAAQSADGHDQHPDRYADQQQGIAERSQHLGALQPEGALLGRRAGSQGRRDEGQDEARYVGQYVAGVGEQCKRPGDETADHLSDEHRRS